MSVTGCCTSLLCFYFRFLYYFSCLSFYFSIFLSLIPFFLPSFYFFNFKCFHKSTFDSVFVLLNICLKTCLFLMEISPALISFSKFETFIFISYIKFGVLILDKLILEYSNPTQSRRKAFPFSFRFVFSMFDF